MTMRADSSNIAQYRELTQMVDFVTAYGKDGVGFTFRNGMDVPTKNE